MGGGAGSGGGANYHGHGPVDRVYHFSEDAPRKKPIKKKGSKKTGPRSRSGSSESIDYDSSRSYERDEFSSPPPRQLPPPPGLKNVGNSCYANAALQCLLSTALPHALLDERNAHIIRRHSFNRKLLQCGSGSVDSEEEDDDSETGEFGSCLSGITGDYFDDDEVLLARGQEDPLGFRTSPSAPSKVMRKRLGSKDGTAGKRRIRDDATIGSCSTLNSDMYHTLNNKRRSSQQPSEADLLCAWLTQELSHITREYTTPPQGFYEKKRRNQPADSRCSTGLFGAVFGSSSNSSNRNTSQNKNRVVDPGSITRHVHKISSTLRPYQQEDAHEFFRSLLSSLTMHGQNARLSSLFDGLLESSVTCKTCNKSSLTRDRYMDLSLDIADRNITSLERALGKFTEEETLDQDNMVTCSRCKAKRVVTKGLRLATAPTMLVINYKRFAYDNYGRLSRLSKPVSFPLRLEIGKYMSRANRGNPPPYTLVAVLVHRGRSCDCGHYFAYVRKGQDWYLANDSVVTKVDVDEVLSAQAYVLVYEVEGMKERHGFDCYSRYHKSMKDAEEAALPQKQETYMSSLTRLIEACDVGLCGSTSNVMDNSVASNLAEQSSQHSRRNDSHTYEDIGLNRRHDKFEKSSKTKQRKALDDMSVSTAEQGDAVQKYYKRGRSHTPLSRSNRTKEKEHTSNVSMFDFEPPAGSHRRAKSLSRVEVLKSKEDQVEKNSKGRSTRRRSRSRDGTRPGLRGGTLPPLHEQYGSPLGQDSI